jgi:hypothetical protein
LERVIVPKEPISGQLMLIRVRKMP